MLGDKRQGLDPTFRYGAGDVRYDPQKTYQLRGCFANQIQILSMHLTQAGFDPDKAGIY